MKKTLFQWICLVIGVVTGLAVLGGVALWLCVSYFFITSTGDYENLDPDNKPYMIETTLEWGRLAPFPDNIENFTIKAGGSIFTKSFRGSFNAQDSQIIDTWMKNSPGIMEAAKETMPDGGVKYIISPGGGAQHAEVIVNKDVTSVDFYVFWS
jgi:hypothetical protein